MKRSTITAQFAAPPETVWQIVTDNQDTAWRSDLARVELAADGQSCTEYAKRGGAATHFTITKFDPCREYRFTMEHLNFTGEWVGLFRPMPGGGTEIAFTEYITMKSANCKCKLDIR